MFEKLLRPQVDLAVLLLRVGLAAIFMVHGYIKISQEYPLIEDVPLGTQVAIGWVELVCGFALVLGVLSRLAALVIIPIQVAAIYLITGNHAMEGLTIKKQGVDWMRAGPEYNLVLIVMCLCVILLGSGSLSVDAFIAGRRRAKPPIKP
jgi:uncharacterized membrane protein YphA (DoxX/SURF4 family)